MAYESAKHYGSTAPAKLKEYLKKRRLTYDNLAELLGKHPNTIKSWIYYQGRPEMWMRYVLQVLTRGKVRDRDWLNAEEREKFESAKEQIRRIRMMKPRRAPDIIDKAAGII